MTPSLRASVAVVVAMGLAGCSGAPDEIAAVALGDAAQAEVVALVADAPVDPRHAILIDMRVDVRAPTPDPDRASERAVAAIGAGAVLMGALEGSFSASGARETVYLIDDADGVTWLVLPGDTGMRVVVPDAVAMIAAPDSNRDGANEILVRFDRETDGERRADLTLVSLLSAAPATVAFFEVARIERCGGGDGSVEADQITYGPAEADGAWPAFVVARSESPCTAGGAPTFATFLEGERRIDARAD